MKKSSHLKKGVVILILQLMMLLFIVVNGQAPTITSFAPAFGPTATTVVTISGTNFNTTPGNNIVMFGATKATVSAASATSLTVTAPNGATYQPITVLNTATALMGTSSKPFITTFTPAKANLSAVDFSTKASFNAFSGPNSVAIGDLDGDGKPDLAVALSTTNLVAVYRNISTSGTITTGSFATSVTFSTGTSTQPKSVAIGDLDGDGKPELVTANISNNTVSVFRNTSTSGAITAGSFAARVDFTTGVQPIDVAIGDIDKDGKPDLAVANRGAFSVSVLRNTSTTGSIGFATKVDFTTGTSGSEPYSVAIGDFDGDSKSDLAVVNRTNHTISILRNTSTSGTITAASFAARVDFTTGTTSNPNTLAIGDLDGDGKIDLAVSKESTNTVSIFRNTSTSGTITTASFAASIDFAAGTAPESVAISDLDGDGKPDIVIPNYTSNTISILRNTSTSGTIVASSFAAKVDLAGTALTGGAGSSAIGDLDADGKPDIVVCNPNNTSFTIFKNSPILPEITSFSPASGIIGSSVIITGKSFNTTPSQNIVFFGAVKATVTASSATSLTATVPPGATYDYPSVTNLAVNLTAYAARPFNVTLAGNIAFANKQDQIAGTTPQAVSIGDIDGDGKPDLVVANSGTTTISVFRNTSTAGAVSYAAKVDFTTGTNPYAVGIGDVDGDGNPDLAVANFSSNTVSIFRNTSTSGTVSFAARVDFTTGTNPRSVSIGDIDGDGKPDLIVANSASTSISVFRNISTSGTITTGSFAARVNFTTGATPISVRMGDIDGDGKPDLAVANNGAASVSVFRNTSTGGTISFVAKVDFTTGTNPETVAIGDLDGDGKPDLAVANFSSNTVSILRNTSTSGTISLVAKVDFTTGTSPRSVSIGDIDGDGKPDLAVANNGLTSISILKNISTSGTIAAGSFETRVNFTVGSGPYATAIGDLDGDGKPDLAIANAASNTISILQQIPQPSITSFSPASGAIGSTVTITGTFFNTTPAQNVVFFGATKATVTAATATSLTVTVPVGATYQYLSVTNLTGNLTAYSTQPFKVTLAGSFIYANKQDQTTGTGPLSVSIGDIDGDGKPDLAVANFTSNTVSVFRNTSTAGAVSYAAKVDFTTGTNPYAVRIGDVDGDGKPDLVVANSGSATVSVFRNTATSGTITAASFAARVDFATGTSPRAVSIGDIDGDGKPDLAVANFTSNTVSVFRNTGSSGTIGFAAKVDFATGTSPRGVNIGDIDGDGNPDMAIANAGATTVSTFRNTSTIGIISFVAKVDFPTGTTPESVALGDIDGDGKPDLAVANNGSTTVSILRNTSTSGTITAGSFAAKVDFTTGTGPRYVSIGDIDGDGKPDLAVANNGSSSISLLKNTSTSGTITAGSFAAKLDLTSGSGPFSADIGDLDGDGLPDLAVANFTSNTVSVMQQIAPPTITSFSPASGTIGSTVTITGTYFNTTPAQNMVFFGATKATVTAATATSLTVTVPVGATYQYLSVTNLFGNLTAYSVKPFIVTLAGSINFVTKQDQTTGSTPMEVAIGDIDGDGKADLAVANSTTTLVSVIRNTSTAGTLSFALKVDFTTGSDPRSVSIGDIDGDGKPDMVVSNFTAGTVSVFRNTSTVGAVSFAARVDLANASGPRSVTIGDIDGDGRPDLAVANFNSTTVSIYRNTGSIGAISFAAKVDFATGTAPNAVSIGDIDADGKPDLAIANFNSASVSVLRNTSSIGTINFAARVDFTAGTNPFSAVIGDIDGDGKPDLAVANLASNTVSVFQNSSTPGSVAFTAKVDFTTGTAPRSVSIGDIDGDGKPDLAVANTTSNSISILKNISTSGTISAGSFAAGVDFTTGAGPYSVSIGDLDGDGRPDLAGANFTGNTVSVIRQLPLPLPAITSFSPTSGTIGSTVIITGTDFNTTPAQNIVYFGSTKATVAASTATSLTVTVPAGATYQYLSVTNLFGNLTGYSAKPFIVTLAGNIAFANKVDFATGTTPHSLSIGDLDGDGKTDMAVANYSSNTVSLFRNTSTSGTPNFATKVDYPSGSGSHSTSIGDIDGDGKPDVAVANYNTNSVSVLRNSSIPGTVSISAKVDFTTGTNPLSVSLGDLDGDGKPDLAVANFSSNNVSVFRNTSTLVTISFATKVDFTTGTNPLSVSLGDLDGDGKPDLAVANFSSNTISVLLNNSSISGTVSFATKVDLATGVGPHSVSIGDIDGDGKPDLAVANSGSNTVSVFRNTSALGTVSFAARVNFTTGVLPRSVSLGDIDGDGKPDLAVANSTGSNVSVFRNTSTIGTTNFATKVDFAAGTAARSVSIGDIDGDGKPDLATANGGSNTVSVIRQVELPQGSLTANGPFCVSGTGQLTWTASAGTGPFTVVYDDGTANRTATGVASGIPFNVFTNPVTSNKTYTLVSVTYANSTRTSADGFTGGSATIAVNTLPVAGITNNTGSTVLNCLNPAISVTATNGVSYAWNGGATPATAANSFTVPGNYTVTATDANGCTDQESIVITQNLTNSFTGNGNWTDNARWSCGVPPGTGDAIEIGAGAIATLSTDHTVGVGGSLTLAATGTLVIGPTSSLTINGTANFAGQSVIFQSDATGTASLGEITGTLTGATNVTIERYIPQNSSKAWRLLASNTSGQTINQAWQEGAIGAMNNPNPGFGTKITSSGANLAAVQAAGFDTLSLGKSIFKYNQTADVLDFVPNTISTAFASEQGYFLFIRGNRAPGQFGAGAPSTSTVLRSTGTLFQGTQPAATLAAGEFALVRNPYPSRLDMRQMARTGGLVDAYQVWDPKLSGAFGVGGYQTFIKNNTSGDYEVTPGGGSYGGNGSVQNYIESGAAFFVQATGSTGTVQVLESSKASGSQVVFRPSSPLAGSSRLLYSVFSINNGTTNVVDGGFVDFDDEYANAIDVEDVRKNTNFTENIAMLRHNTELVVERRKSVSANDTIFFKMYQMRQISYRIDFESAGFNPLITTAVLQDKFTGINTTIDLSVPTTSFTFTVTSAAGSFATDRFRLLLNTSPNTFSGTGSWTDNARWSYGVPPSGTDVFIIAAGANATLNTNFTVGKSMTMMATSTLTVAPAWTLSVDAGATANFAGQSVTFTSNETGYGSLGQVNGTLTGATNVTVERYIPNNGFRSWRLLSVPTFGSQTIRQSWQENQAPLAVASAPFQNYGTLITDAGLNTPASQANGFDAAASTSALLRWNGTGWTGALNTLSTAISSQKAWFLFVRGERSKGVSGLTSDASATTLRTNGTVYTGNQVTEVPTGAFTLIGNVYPSAINFTQMARSNVNNLFYIWDSKKLSGNSLGAYQTFSGTNSFNCLIAGGSYTAGQPNTTIESGQGFFVVGGATPGGGSITLLESSKFSGSNGNLGFRPAPLVKIDSRLYNSQGDMRDANTVVFNAGYSKAIDRDDAPKLGNPAENFAVESNSKILAIEGTQPLTNDDAIQFRMWNLQQQDYKLEFVTTNIAVPGMEAVLEDSYLETNSLVNLDGTTSVNFTVTADAASKAANRFRIVFRKVPAAAEVKQGYSIAPNPVVNGNVNLQFMSQAAGKYAVRIVSNEGKTVMLSTITHTGGNYNHLLNIPSVIGRGVYQVEIISPGKKTQSLTFFSINE